MSDLSHLTSDPKALQRIKHQASELLSFRKLEAYSPYEKQREFHEAGATFRERLLMACNQGGKCISFTSKIPHPDGTETMIGELAAHGQPFQVLAWDGEKLVPAWATHAFKKAEPAECYRVTFSDGSVLEAADKHRLLTADGLWVTVDEVYAAHARRLVSAADPLASTSELARSVHAEDAPSSSRTPSGCPDHCSPDFHQCGAPLPSDRGCDQAPPPSPADVLRHASASSHADAPAGRDTNSGQLSRGHPSNRDADRLPVALSSVSRSQALGSADEPCPATLQESLPPNAAVASQLQSDDADERHQLESVPALLSPQMGMVHVYRIEAIGVHDVYDMTVPEFANYFHAGVINHNTYCGAAEMAMHLTGLYPAWWRGRKFDRPVTAWAASETALLTRDAPQRNLLGPVGEMGKGMIPRDLIVSTTSQRGVADAVDTAKIKHISGGLSTLGFRAYEQGREKWQGATLDCVWFDEEPPPDVYDEGLTRTNATNGFVFTTFTPLKGMSKVVRYFYPKPNTADRSLVRMELEDVGHISPAQRQRIIDSAPEHIRDARVRGIPTLGDGAVFPVPESQIIIDPIPLGDHLVQIAGIDIGWAHPCAAARLAWDRDADVIYVTHTYAVAKQTLDQHAAVLRHWGKGWLPWAWPHDALSADKSSGKPIARILEDGGLNMLPDRAQFEDGGNSVEAGVMEMLDRMTTGRWKVFSSCVEWIEEFRTYCRSDGRIVKEHDDCLSASRYAMMMLRYAVPGGHGKLGNGPLKRGIRVI